MPQQEPRQRPRGSQRSTAFDLWRRERVERAAPRKQSRINELRVSHWIVRRCGAGHVTETHRTNADGDADQARCPICGRDALRESYEQTAQREHEERTTPQRVLAQMADAMTAWAQEHLDAFVWSLRSQDMREQRDHQIGQNPTLRKYR